MSINYTKKELEAYRKYHYWRGFKIGVAVIVIPLVIAFVVLANIYINANI